MKSSYRLGVTAAVFLPFLTFFFGFLGSLVKLTPVHDILGGRISKDKVEVRA